LTRRPWRASRRTRIAVTCCAAGADQKLPTSASTSSSASAGLASSRPGGGVEVRNDVRLIGSASRPSCARPPARKDAA
jgi:hypothetical protein